MGLTKSGMDGVLHGERLGVLEEALQAHRQSRVLANLDGL
jgi:hypothetical protein